MSTWREKIKVELASFPGETIIASTLSDDMLDTQFYDGYGSPEGAPFTAWTQHRVIFPVCYDGAEWVASVPREPSDEVTEHIGGF